MRTRSVLICGAVAAVALVSSALPASASGPSAGTNVRVTVDDGTQGSYVSAGQLSGGTYTDAVLQRCGTDLRQQNEPTLAIDPRDPSVWTSGSNDYCTVPTAGDTWAGFYRSINGGSTWTDSLLPGYNGDTSAQGLSSPLHHLVAAGALAAGDPMMSWDGQGDLFYMGNNFNRGIENGVSGRFRDNVGSIWVATYAPANPSDHSTDGSHYVRTVILAQNTFGLGNFNDKTDLTVDPVTGNVYAAWSDFHGNGCNKILFSRSTDHGASFSAPLKISSGICGNQGPSIVIGPAGQVDIGWQANTGGALAKATTVVTGAAFVSSADFGQTFSKARIAVNYTPFISGQFSGNGSRECGDGAFACPTGQTFPRFDLAGPYLAADNTHGTLVMGFQAAQASGQGQIEYVFSANGGATWSSAALLAPSATGHQFFPWLVASNGRVSAI
jgi:hypothetical protein